MRRGFGAEKAAERRRFRGPAAGAGMTLCLVLAALASRRFPAELPWPAFGLPAALMVAAGLFYLGWVPRRGGGAPPGRRLLWVGLILGLVMRGAAMFGNPAPEDDFYRYLWDGAVAAHGHNPYRYPPKALWEAAPEATPPAAWVQLARTHEDLVARINHPHLVTIYPPTAVAVFALAHFLTPWKPLGLQLCYLAADLATLLFLLGVLRERSRDLAGVLVFWMNPLYISETYRYLHMDAVVLAFIAAFLYFAVKRRPILTGLALAAAAGAKFWPLWLWPWGLKESRPTRGRIWASILVTVVFLAAILAPMAAGFAGKSSGLSAYARVWENNDFLFRGLKGVLQGAIPGRWGMRAARGVVLVLVSAAAAAAMRAGPLLPVAALFLFSPTQFPWYYAWLLPFLCLRPCRPLEGYTATLPLYRALPLVSLGTLPEWWMEVIPALEHGPILAWLAWDAVRRWGPGRSFTALEEAQGPD